jgi:hypothetical protein
MDGLKQNLYSLGANLDGVSLTIKVPDNLMDITTNGHYDQLKLGLFCHSSLSSIIFEHFANSM